MRSTTAARRARSGPLPGGTVASILTENDVDDGAVGIGLTVPQYYWFSIDIEDEDGNVVYDTIPAEYNLSPTLQDVIDTGTNGATCDPGAATDCTADDDICQDRDGDVVPCNGFAVTGDCTVVHKQPNGAKGGRFKEPELLTNWSVTSPATARWTSLS